MSLLMYVNCSYAVTDNSTQLRVQLRGCMAVGGEEPALTKSALVLVTRENLTNPSCQDLYQLFTAEMMY